MPRIIPRPAATSAATATSARRPLTFALQFEIDEVARYAQRYTYEDDTEVLAIAASARQRGHYELPELIEVCRWKTPRSRSRVALNTRDTVARMTRIALAPAATEHERIKALRSLPGVDYPTASVLLHLPDTERYPILDFRALEALGVPRGTSYYSFRFWQAYVAAWRPLVAQAGVDGRTFDRALWQWSKDQGSRRHSSSRCTTSQPQALRERPSS